MKKKRQELFHPADPVRDLHRHCERRRQPHHYHRHPPWPHHPVHIRRRDHLAVTFLCTDIVGEIWGRKKAQSMVFFGFVGQIFATIAIILTGWCRAVDPVIDGAYQTLLGQNWVFVIGSLCAYYASQSWDVFVFHKIRDAYIRKHGDVKGGRWIWNNGSTCTSQIIDTAIYAFISFGLGLGWAFTPEGRMNLIGMMIGQYLLKACLALADTPFFYFFTRREVTEHGNEYQENAACRS
mgnify:CR=1 FL=1